MTSQGTAHGRFTRAIKTRNLWVAEMALREIGKPSLLDALDYLDLLAETRPEKLEPAVIRWHGRLEIEAWTMTLAVRFRFALRTAGSDGRSVGTEMEGSQPRLGNASPRQPMSQGSDITSAPYGLAARLQQRSRPTETNHFVAQRQLYGHRHPHLLIAVYC